VAKSPIAGESTKETVKTIACGKRRVIPGYSFTRVHFYQCKAHTRLRCHGHPAFPTPSISRAECFWQNPGRAAPRGANARL